jgi:hypothetical protein
MLIEKEQPNYYSIIPATVRYDKDLKANEKLLYGEITSLTQKSGKCFASNNYFAELYGVAKETVSGWISNLEKKGYIKREIIYKEGTKEIINRYIIINEHPINEKINTPINEKIKGNNTRINNTSNNKEKTNKKKNEIEEIFNYWNSKKIIVHDKITATIENAINKFIKNNSLELTKLCIDRYSEILKDDNYFFKYKWTLSDFLNRKTGAVEFLDGGSKWQSYLFKTINKNKSTQNTQVKKSETYGGER